MSIETCFKCGEDIDVEPGFEYEDKDTLVCELCAKSVYCHACSEAGGADRAIYHLPPACPDSVIGEEKKPCECCGTFHTASGLVENHDGKLTCAGCLAIATMDGR